jgi:hypothetical protein
MHSLLNEYGIVDVPDAPTTEATALPKILPVDLAKPPPPIRVVYSLGITPVCTAGNLTAITAAAKAGKSASIGAMVAAAMVPEGAKADTLGWISSNPQGLALLHFDTEQPPDDHWHLVARAARRAGLSALPPCVLSYSLAGMSSHVAFQTVKRIVAESAEKFGGIHSIIIDGGADLVADVNDAGECNAHVAELHALAIAHDCPIIVVIHFNPGSEKTRGHYGSQLERKAESNLKLEKDAGEITEVWADKQRRQPIPKGTGPRFRWSNDHGMHVSCPANFIGPAEEARREALKAERDDVFGDRRAMTYTNLRERVMATVKVQQRTAERRIDTWKRADIIGKTVANLWEKKDL